MLTKSQKTDIVNDLTDKLKRQKITIFTDFHGIVVSKSQTLRRALRKVGAEYKVAKKTLLARALQAVGIEIPVKELQGEIGVAFGYQEEIQPAKELVKFSKGNETFKIVAGLLSGRVLTDKEVFALAKLPGREILLTELLGTLQSPIRNLAAVLTGNIRNLIILLNNIKDKR